MALKFGSPAWRKKYLHKRKRHHVSSRRRLVPRQRPVASRPKTRKYKTGSTFMARRRKRSRRSRVSGFGKKILGIRVPPMVAKAASGIGMASIAGIVIDRFVPQAQPYKNLAQLGAAYVGGGIEGVVGQVIVNGGLQGILPGGTATSSGASSDPNMVG